MQVATECACAGEQGVLPLQPLPWWVIQSQRMARQARARMARVVMRPSSQARQVGDCATRPLLKHRQRRTWGERAQRGMHRCELAADLEEVHLSPAPSQHRCSALTDPACCRGEASVPLTFLPRREDKARSAWDVLARQDIGAARGSGAGYVEHARCEPHARSRT